MTPELDCRRCGACCQNPTENRTHHYEYYIRVYAGDALHKKPELWRRFVVLDERDVPHLRLTPEGRCRALAGAVGDRVRCTIYYDRPTPCRRVEAGSELCRFYRRDAGLDPIAPS